MVVIGYDSVEAFVRQQERRGNDIRWDGHDLVFFFTPRGGDAQVIQTVNRTKGDIRTGGARRNGVWGLETRVSVSNDGSWHIPARSVKFARRNKTK